MMKNHTLNRKVDLFNVKQGTVIRGSWNKNKYYVLRKLGQGMIGAVYLCRFDGRFVALKISEQATSITAEVNVLKSINQAQVNQLGPLVYDVDDWQVSPNVSYSFYVMEYVRGVSMEEFVRRNGPEWIGIFLIQMLDELERLHQAGWVFGDLKNDNILIDQHSQKVRLIDVGGTTKIGRSVKEYSEFYDRAYWGLGNRRAEPSYDLFALVMVILRIFYRRQFKKGTDSRRLICKKLSNIHALSLYRHSLQKAVLGQFHSASAMKNDVMKMLLHRKIVRKEKNKQGRFKFSDSFVILTMTTVYAVITYILF